MAKKSLLLVDADPRSLRVLEVSLRKAGYSVATCRDATSAVEMVELSMPDLVLSDTRLPGTNGFELVEELRKHEEYRDVPVMFLSSDSSVESKVRGLELGVEDYLTKPIYIKEIITRINLTLQRQEREGLARRTSVAKTRFTGSLGDMGLVDLLQTIDISRKSGVLELSNPSLRGTVTFRDGQLVDAELGRVRGESAIYRLLLWNEGEFEIDFRPVRADQQITSSTQAILMEGMRRIDEWGRLLEQIPSLDNVFEISEEELVERLAEIPDEINEILRHIDGRRSLHQVLDASGGDDLETLTAITKLYFEGIIFPTGRTAGEEPIGDDELVPGAGPSEELVGAAEPAVGEAGDDEIELVPKLQTLPPPAVERASPNTAAATIVSGRAEPVASADPWIDTERAVDLLGTEPALAGGGGESATDALAAQPSEWVEPPSEPAEQELQLEELSPETDTPSASDTASESEEAMTTKKGRRRRKRRAKELEVQTAAAQSQSASNVIQFPAQAKRAVGASQVAVNDDVLDTEESAPSAAAPVSEARRDDETQTRSRKEDSKAEQEEAAAEAAPLAPAPEVELAERAPTVEVEAIASPTPEPSVEKIAPETIAPEPEPAQTKPAQTKPAQTKPAQTKPARQEEDEKPTRERDEAKPREEEKREAQAKKREDEKKRQDEKKQKKTTTTSAEIPAVADTGEHAAVAEDFFKSSDRPQPIEHETWDDLQRESLPISAGMKNAKYATFAIVAAGVAIIGGILVYNNLIMPTPAELSRTPLPRELPSTQATPGPSGPAQATPTQAEPAQAAQAEPTQAEPAQAEPTQAEPGQAEPGQAEPGQAEPVQAEPAQAEPTQAEPVQAEPVQAEPVQAEPVQAEPAAPAAGSYEQLLAEANEMRRRRPTQAAEAYQRAIQANPRGAEALAELGFLTLNRRQNQEAAGYAQRAVEADPTSALGWLVLGAARQELRDAPGAREAFQQCIAQGADQRRVRECRQMLPYVR